MNSVEDLDVFKLAHQLALKTYSVTKTLEDYPDDTPYPSRLVLGWNDRRPIHVVVADNVDEQENIVITVYEPDPLEWEPDFKRRKNS
ncbi:MAG TPA: DUF4258 domain-containing protein [Candidatus Binatia bacterium]|nr:DUF4258 domain-containing protein [Candidatus Binatia bacterium]